ncbi:homocysteine S-methyltransferase family protein [Haliovirga abyssi]|uniref:Methionine synthase n=1 Tax=Haliovirga abyssi TaxID=2996794 RepID=A0AAU9DER5_9FUSO|nr:homocysteine S-methyltransferase family protein [Haliovirga abyssi]BDU50867.1 5-methyltetrahydrofolate--homocysteine methyltransferase [Haliovirga abyssi]
MNKEWLDNILNNEVLILDGAMGTELQKLGMKPGYCPELLNIEDPEMVKKVHKSYVDAGSNIIEANTFGGNRLKLKEFGLENKIEELNIEGIKIAKEMAKDKAKVFASVSSTGKFIEPMGDYTFDEIYDVFKEQALILEKAGADGVIIETMTDIHEMKAVVIAFKENTNLPIFASMTFQADGRSVTGTDPKTAAIILDALGVDAIGVNCSLGSEGLYKFLEEMIEVTDVPLFVQPNAGLPRLEGDKTVFDATPEFMLEYSEKFYDLGINIIGGCCGTTPTHMRKIAERFKNRKSNKKKLKKNITYLTSRSQFVGIGYPEMVKILGERINPNALKRIKEDIKEYRTTQIRKEAIAQVEAGADVLDINVGLGTIDEAKMMKKAIIAVQNIVNVPLTIDTTDIIALEAGLKAYSGKPLINSVMGKKKSMETIFPLAKKYGAAVLGLALDENGIPATAEERLKVAEKIVKTGMEYGIKKEDILIDTLVLTASAEQDKVLETVKAIELVKKELGVNTVLGVSNISFGLPNRKYVNAAFLSMCIGAGLDLPIMSPMNMEMKNALMASCVLTGRDKNSGKYILYSSGMSVTETKKDEKDIPLEKQAYNCVIKGDTGEIKEILEKILESGEKPLDIVNKILIPAITEVGDLYDKGIYFLPQLMMSAEAMKKGVERVKKEIKEGDSNSLGKVIFATVKNDIHDIGKNIVTVLLENNGFEIVDLGKDVPTEEILEAAKRENVDIIGLSALMTTTMVEMRKTIEAIRKEKLSVDIMVGGAVVTPDFAETMGAYYSKDAVEAVKVAKEIMKKRGIGNNKK